MGTMTLGIVGARDRQLEELAHACGLRPTALQFDDLNLLAQPGAQQPAVILLDLRERPVLPSSIAVLRRQHPTTGVVIVAAALEPVLMLEAMRAGVTEFVTAPLTAPELQAALRRVVTPGASTTPGQIFAFLGAKGGVGTTTIGVNVATALAQFQSGSTLLIDLHLAYGDAALFLGAEPRFSVLDALDNVHRLDRAFFRGLVSHDAGWPRFPGLIGSRKLAAGRRGSRPDADRNGVPALPLRRTRRAAIGRRLLDVLDLRPASSSSPLRNWPPFAAATRVAATLRTALRQRSGRGRGEPFDKRREHPRRKMSNACSGPASRTRSRATIAWRWTH